MFGKRTPWFSHDIGAMALSLKAHIWQLHAELFSFNPFRERPRFLLSQSVALRALKLQLRCPRQILRRWRLVTSPTAVKRIQKSIPTTRPTKPARAASCFKAKQRTTQPAARCLATNSSLAKAGAALGLERVELSYKWVARIKCMPTTLDQQSNIPASGSSVHRHGLLGAESVEVMRATGFGARAA